MSVLRDVHLKAIFDTELNTAPFLRAATLLVTQHLSGAGLAEALTDEITLYLAAHFASARDPRFTQVSTDGQSMTFAHIDYLSLALQLDPTGLLADAFARTKRISIKVF